MEAGQFSAVCVKLSLGFASLLQPLGISASGWAVSVPVCISVDITVSIFNKYCVSVH